MCCLAHAYSAFKHTNNGYLAHAYSACAPRNLEDYFYSVVALCYLAWCYCNFNEMYKSFNTNQKHIYTNLYNERLFKCYMDYYNTLTVNDSTSHVSFLTKERTAAV